MYYKKEPLYAMKGKYVNIILILLATLILFGFAVFKLYQVNEQQKANLQSLVIGETIDYFDLISDDSSRLNSSVLDSSRPALIFILSRPCNPCQENFKYWRKIKEILGDRANCYGIILDDISSAFTFAQDAQLNFKLYVPLDINKFKEKLRIKLSLAQTILYTGGQVKFLKLGTLDGEEATEIINLTKTFI